MQFGLPDICALAGLLQHIHFVIRNAHASCMLILTAGTSPQSADMGGLAGQRIAALQAELAEARRAAASAAQSTQEMQQRLFSEREAAADQLDRVRAEAAASAAQAAEQSAKELDQARCV